MNPPYRPTYKMVLRTEDGREIHVGNFERLDEASAFIRQNPPQEACSVRLYKLNRAEDIYEDYEKWSCQI